MSAKKFIAAILLTAAFAMSPGMAAESYYGVDVMLETHDGEKMALDTLQGRPALVSMFYASCPHVCPMLINTLQQVERQLTPGQREGLRVLMVSVDPERDTPEVLARMVREYRIDEGRWTLARAGDDADTRLIAALLDIKYRRLPDGEFNHTSTMILLDEEGRELARSGRLGKPDAAFVRAVQAAL